MTVKDSDWKNIFSSYGASSGLGIDWNATEVSDTEYSIQPKLYRHDGYTTTNEEIVISYTLSNLPNGYASTKEGQMLAVWAGTSKGSTEMKYPSQDSMFMSPLVYKRKDSAYSVTIKLWWSFWKTASSSESSTDDRYDVPYTLGPLYWTFTIPAADSPNAPTNVKVTRVSDYENTVTWSASGTSSISGFNIYRSVNGGSYTLIGSASSSATSFTDKQTSSDAHPTTDCYYTYKVASTNGVKSSYSTASTATYNTPNAPSKVKATRQSGTTVSTALTNASNTANSTEIQVRYGASGTWATWYENTSSIVTSRTGSVTESSVPIYFRARNKRVESSKTLVSEWSPVSNAISVPVAPFPPTIVSPSNGYALKKGENINLEWIHNSRTESKQGDAIIYVYVSTLDNPNYYTKQYNKSGVSTLTIPTSSSSFPEDSYVRITVRTIDYGYMEASSESAVEFVIAPTPVVSFNSQQLSNATETYGDFTFDRKLTGFPMSYTVTSSGASEIASFKIDVYALDVGWTLDIDDDGIDHYIDTIARESSNPIYSKYVIGNSGSIGCEDFGTSAYGYEFDITATNQYGISSSIVVNAVNKLSDVKPFAATATQNKADDSVTIATSKASSMSTGVDPNTVSVVRMIGDVRETVASEVPLGSVITDKYPPLNKRIVYQVIAHGENSKSIFNEVPVTVTTSKWYFHHPDGSATAIYDPTGSFEVSRSNSDLVQYDGRDFPVRYGANGVSYTETIEFTCFTYEEAIQFVDLVIKYGRCLYRSGDGRVYHADISCSVSPEYTNRGLYGKVTAKLTRIDGD